eukprot:3799289-Amphidinium_carterae.1
MASLWGRVLTMSIIFTGSTLEHMLHQMQSRLSTKGLPDPTVLAAKQLSKQIVKSVRAQPRKSHTHSTLQNS